MYLSCCTGTKVLEKEKRTTILLLLPLVLKIRDLTGKGDDSSLDWYLNWFRHQTGNMSPNQVIGKFRALKAVRCIEAVCRIKSSLLC